MNGELSKDRKWGDRKTEWGEMEVVVIESLMRKTKITDEEVLKQYDNEQQWLVIMGRERKKRMGRNWNRMGRDQNRMRRDEKTKWRIGIASLDHFQDTRSPKGTLRVKPDYTASITPNYITMTMQWSFTPLSRSEGLPKASSQWLHFAPPQDAQHLLLNNPSRCFIMSQSHIY